MKIKPTSTSSEQARRAQLAQEQNLQVLQEKAKRSNGGKETTIEISSLARELSTLEVNQEEQIRPDRVEAVRRKIANGELASSEEVAKKVIEDLVF